MPPVVFDAQGQRISLGPELGRGGEGAVFEVAGAPVARVGPLVAKLYKTRPPSAKAEKLTAMSRGGTPPLLAVAAWPVGTLHDANGAVVGLTMQRISEGREIHYLYGPSHRRQAFPAADWKFLVHAARNLAAAVATVHGAGAVIGDVNQGNALIDQQARVKLIDCDSFQIPSARGWHLCEVGIAHFTPPELQGAALDKVIRTPAHDAFGLAVLVFHLLFMGRHPFAGQFHGPGDMPIERAIKEHRFAFGAGARTRLMSRPPMSLALTDTSPVLVALFERAFSRESALGQSARPTPAEWVGALEGFEASLAPCKASNIHMVPAGAPRCPWCALEGQGAPDFFASVRHARAGMSAPAAALPAAFDYNRLVRQVGQTAWVPQSLVVALAGVPPAPVPAPPPLDAAAKNRLRLAGIGWLTGVGTLAAGAFGLDPVMTTVVGGGLCGIGASFEHASGVRQRRRQRQATLGSAGADTRTKEQQYTQLDHEVPTRLTQLKTDFQQAARRFEEAATEEQRELSRLAASQQEDQLRDYLDRFYIEQADIPGLGQGLKATLASFGVETAWDVGQLGRMKIPGIGTARSYELRAWREMLKQGFRFNPSIGANPAAASAIRDKSARTRAAAARDMMALSGEMERRIHGAAELRRELALQHSTAAAGFQRVRAEVQAIDNELAILDVVTGRRNIASRVVLAIGAFALVARLAGPSMPSTASAGTTGATTEKNVGTIPPLAPSPAPVSPAPSPRPSSAELAVTALGALKARCGDADSVCVFSSPHLEAPVLYEAGLRIYESPEPARKGWFRVTLGDGTTGYIRSADMPRVVIKAPKVATPDSVYVP